MTHPSINCGRFNEQLADFLERNVSEPTRAAMESHAVTCDDCGPLLADLRRLRIDAVNLPELAPSRDLWSVIAARIEAPVVAMPGARAAHGRHWNRSIYLGLAAAGLVAVTATITRTVDRGRVGARTREQHANATRPSAPEKPAVAVTAVPDRSSPSKPAARASDVSVRPVHQSTSPPVRLASNKPSAEQTYDHEIARLLAVYNQRRPDLDSNTIAVVKKNLKIIDDAIAQTRAALRRDPASQFLMESLNDAFDTKVELLRKATMLPSGT